MLHPQKTPQRASYGMSLVNICEKINRVITAPRSINYDVYISDVWSVVHILSFIWYIPLHH